MDESGMSTCRSCKAQAPSTQFFMPDVFCSQACYDKRRPSAHRHVSTTTGKRKKKRASYLEGYEADYRGKVARRASVSLTDRRRGSTSSSKGAAAADSPPETPSPFLWSAFLRDEKLVAAPENLFLHTTYEVNGFSEGLKLEGIDPLHPSLFCVLTVAEIKGQRLRLHFDGYSELHDFWTYCYHDGIFPAGWCERNGKQLTPPRDWPIDEPFDWSAYLQQTKSEAASESLFLISSPSFKGRNAPFKPNEKLEAEDIKNNMLVCVASVADTYCDLMLIHFDGWEDSYDYWCRSDCPNIHPVGWCLANRQILSCPNDYPEATKFTWERYFAETNSKPAPSTKFGKTLENDFEVGMAVEEIDARNPILVRVAQVVSVIGSRVKLHWCGWEEKYDHWIDHYSPDIHPPGWCEKTGVELQAPLTPLDIAIQRSACATPGCSGAGHIKGSRFTYHTSTVGCPYSDFNLKKDTVVPDRLAGYEHIAMQFSSVRNVTVMNHNDPEVNPIKQTAPVQAANSELRSPVGYMRRKVWHRDADTSEILLTSHVSTRSALHVGPVINPQQRCATTNLQEEVHRSVFLTHTSIKQKASAKLTRQLLRRFKSAHAKFEDISSWKPDEVVSFLNQIIPEMSARCKLHILQQKIDGEALLLLEQSDLILYLGLKLGPALKVFTCIQLIKQLSSEITKY